MNVPRKGFPGLVHEAAAFVEEAPSVLIDDDAVGIDQHHRRRMAGCADRPVRCACRSSRPRRAPPALIAMRMPSPVSKRVPGEISLTVSRAGPKCCRIIAGLPWKPPDARMTASASSVVVMLSFGSQLYAADPALAHRSAASPRIAKLILTPAFLRRLHQPFDDRAAAADRLNARRAGAEIIDRLECDAMGLQPSNRRAARSGKRPEIIRDRPTRPRPPAYPLRNRARPGRARPSRI